MLGITESQVRIVSDRFVDIPVVAHQVDADRAIAILGQLDLGDVSIDRLFSVTVDGYSDIAQRHRKISDIAQRHRSSRQQAIQLNTFLSTKKT